MNINPFKRATASAPGAAGADLALELQIAEVEAKYNKTSALANATRDHTPRKKLAMGQLEALGRHLGRAKYRITLLRCIDLIRSAQDAVPEAVARCKSQHDLASKAAKASQSQIDDHRVRLARVTAQIDKATRARSERDMALRESLEKATVAGEDAVVVQSTAELNAFLGGTGQHNAEVQSLEVQQRALSAAVVEQEAKVKSSLAVCEKTELELRDVELEAPALRADMAMLQASEEVFKFVLAGGRVSDRLRGVVIMPGLSRVLRDELKLTEAVRKDFSALGRHYFGQPHEYESRLDEDPMVLSDRDAA